MLPQQGPVPGQTSRLQRTWDDSVAAEVDRALRSLQAAPVNVLRPSSPAPDPGSTRLPSLGLQVQYLASSSAPTLSRQGARGPGGTEAFAALRSALHLRESNLLQPQHAGLSAARKQADERALEPALQLPDAEPQSDPHGVHQKGSPSLLNSQTPREPVQVEHAVERSIAPSAVINGETEGERTHDGVAPLAAMRVRQVSRFSYHVM